MVVWQGITEGGTAVPVQVKENGKVVAEGLQGPEGPEGPEGPQGPEGPEGPEGPPGNPVLRSVKSKDLYGTAVAYCNFDGNVKGTFLPKSGHNIARIEWKSTGVFEYFFQEPQPNGYVITTDWLSYSPPELPPGPDSFILYWYNLNKSGVYDWVNWDPGNANVAVFGKPVKVGSADGPDGIDQNGNLIVTGSASFAEDKAGVEADGSLVFSSRGNKYQIFVQNGICMAEPFNP